MAIESGPNLEPMTPISIGGERSAGTGMGTLNSLSSLPSFPESSLNIVPNSPTISLKDLYPIQGGSSGTTDGLAKVSDFPIIIAQAPEVTLTEKSGLEISPVPLNLPSYEVRNYGIDDAGVIEKEPDLPSLADIEFSLPSRRFLDDAGLIDNAPTLDVPQGITESLADVNLDPDASLELVFQEIDQITSRKNLAENKDLYPEVDDKIESTAETSLFSGAKKAEVTLQIEEVIKTVGELSLTADQARKMKAAVLKGTELDQEPLDLSTAIFPEAVVIENEQVDLAPLVIVAELEDRESIYDETSVKSSEQRLLEQPLASFLATSLSPSEIQRKMRPIAVQNGLQITARVDEDEAELEGEVTERKVQELREVLIGVKAVSQATETPKKSPRTPLALIRQRLQKIPTLYASLAEKEANNRMNALKDATKKVFEGKEKDLAGQPRQISGLEIVAQVSAPKEMVNSPINGKDSSEEEGWALTLLRFAHEKFDDPEKAYELARRLVFEEIRPVKWSQNPNPPVGEKDIIWAMSHRRDPLEVTASAKSQVSSLPKAA